MTVTQQTLFKDSTLNSIYFERRLVDLEDVAVDSKSTRFDTLGTLAWIDRIRYHSPKQKDNLAG